MRGRATYGAWVLGGMPGTPLQISLATHITRQSVSFWARRFVAAGEAHIVSWTGYRGKKAVPVYAVGAGKNVPRPKKMTQNQRGARCRANAKQDGRWELKLEKARTARAVKNTIRTGDPLVNALFGRSV